MNDRVYLSIICASILLLVTAFALGTTGSRSEGPSERAHLPASRPGKAATQKAVEQGAAQSRNAAASARRRYQQGLVYAQARVRPDIRSRLNFLNDVLGDVVGQMLRRVEDDDANRIIELPRYKVADDGIEVCALDLGLAVDAAAAKAINYQVNRLIRAKRHGIR